MTRLLIAIITAVQLASANATEPLAGYERFALQSQHRTQPIAASIWYPTVTPSSRGLIGDSPIFIGTPAYIGANPVKGRYRLVLLSHGSGGNMDNLAWLSSRLAQNGVLVLAVNHPGSTSGDSSSSRSLRLDERAADLSSALDHVLTDPVFSALIDPSQINVVGFSLGGATALGLAGAKFDRGQYRDYCDRMGQRAPDCIFLAKGGVDLASLPSGFAADLQDARINKVVAIDPGFSYAITKQSAAAVKRPTLLINLGGKDRWKTADVSANGSNLVGKLPNANYAVVAPAHHYTFLALCKSAGKQILEEEGDDPVCDDPDGTNRAKAHEEMIERIINFLL